MSTSENLLVRLRNVNLRSSLRLYRRHTHVINMYKAAFKEFKNTEYFNLVQHLYNVNQRRTIFLTRRHPYVTNMYNSFLKAKQEKLALEAKPSPVKPSPAKKAAVLIGINYKGTENELGGCENDIINTKKVLMSQYGFEEKEIVMLAESFGEKPTRANILKHMNNLVNKSNKGYTSLWFQYSGHGYYTTDYNGDEADKKDECIVTSDMQLITDDVFTQYFTSRINKKANMFCLMDCCHSGTIMDLKYKYVSENSSVVQNNNVVGANIISLSGCRDDQTSADAWMSGKWRGALTTCFLETLVGTSYKPELFDLLNKVRALLREKNFTQIPQLTSTNTIEKNQVFKI